MNSQHNRNVRVVNCPIQNCDRIFVRREYLQMHLEKSHGMNRGTAKEDARAANLSFAERDEKEFIGQEMRLRIQVQPQDLQDRRVTVENVPNVQDLKVHVLDEEEGERIVVEQYQDENDILSRDSDVEDFDMEVGEVEMAAASSDVDDQPDGDLFPMGTGTMCEWTRCQILMGKCPAPVG